MCMQCAAGAMTVGAGAAGARVWLVHRAGLWLTPRRKKVVSFLLLGTAVVAAGLVGA